MSSCCGWAALGRGVVEGSGGLFGFLFGGLGRQGLAALPSGLGAGALGGAGGLAWRLRRATTTWATLDGIAAEPPADRRPSGS
eukprot:1845517-Lingulodinium_polyedra.AAC.1